MHECESLFGKEAGRKVHELVEESVGDTCPCMRGDPCPIVPGASTARLLTLPDPRYRASA